MKRRALIVCAVVFSLSGAFAGTYSGGAGTSGSPYQIANLNDLLELSNTSGDWVAGKYFIQTADIDASSTNSGDGFNPIGRSGIASFKGNYDGQNHVISSLYDKLHNIGYIKSCIR
ncbi:MAG: hypothetical protein WC703_01915 [Candidatus Neomarinimicrobiota bacterium]